MGPGCRGPAEETVWGCLSLPQQALETALMSQPSEAPPPLGPRGSPAFSGKAEAALASIHRAPEPLASQQWPSLPRSETLHLSSFWFLHSPLDIVPRLSPPSLFLSPSCTVGFIQQDSTPSGFVQEPNSTCVFPFFRGLEVLINIFEEFETSF